MEIEQPRLEEGETQDAVRSQLGKRCLCSRCPINCNRDRGCTPRFLGDKNRTVPLGRGMDHKSAALFGGARLPKNKLLRREGRGEGAFTVRYTFQYH
jgi:hypothetical protein